MSDDHVKKIFEIADALNKCVKRLHELRSDINALFDEAEQKARAACLTTDRTERARLMHEACDAEFDALLNCDATGGLVEALGITDEEMEEQQRAHD